MASDASIRVDTKIDNSDIIKMEKEIDKMTKKLEELRAKSTKMELLGTGTEKQFASLGYDAEILEDKIADATKKLAEMNEIKLDKPEEGFERAEKAGKKCMDTISKSTKKTTSAFGSFMKRIKSVAMGFFVFQTITKIFRNMVSALQEGLQSLAKYSTDYNSAMSGLKSSLATLKNSLATAFEPIITTIVPYVTRLVDIFNMLIDKIAQFNSAIIGRATYTKAKKQNIDYAKSLDKASDSLAGFDQLNVLNKDEGAGGELIGKNAFETKEIESNLVSFANRVKEIFGTLKKSIADWWNELNFAPLESSFAHLLEVIKPISDSIGESVLWLMENVLEPLGTWTIEDALPAFFDLLATAVQGAKDVFEALKPSLKDVWENVLKPIGQWIGEIFVKVINIAKDTFTNLAENIKKHSDSINTIIHAVVVVFKAVFDEVKKEASIILDVFGVMLTTIGNIFGDLTDILAGFAEWFSGVFTGDMEQANNGIKKMFLGTFNILIDVFEGIMNAIIKAVNTLSFDIPSWVPKIGGEKFGFNFPEVSLARWTIPALADGAVIQGGKPFAAILGDQRAGQTNIETPLSTMIEAFKQAQAETGGGSYTFVAQLNGNTIFEETVRQNQLFRMQNGDSAF